MQWLEGPHMRSSIYVSLSFAAVLALAGCAKNNLQHTAEATVGGNYSKGAAALSRYGCGSCHVIPGISGAVGKAGPPLTGIASRNYIAGQLPNTPANMIQWLENPQAINPKTVMPNLGVTQEDAVNMAGYLYTLK